MVCWAIWGTPILGDSIWKNPDCLPLQMETLHVKSRSGTTVSFYLEDPLFAAHYLGWNTQTPFHSNIAMSMDYHGLSPTYSHHDTTSSSFRSREDIWRFGGLVRDTCWKRNQRSASPWPPTKMTLRRWHQHPWDGFTQTPLPNHAVRCDMKLMLSLHTSNIQTHIEEHDKWWCPKIGVPLVIIHSNGSFPFWGVPSWKPPNVSHAQHTPEDSRSSSHWHSATPVAVACD